MARGSGGYGTDGSITIGTNVDMYGMNTGLAKIQKSLRKLSYLTGTAFGIIGLVKFGKAAIDAASDLQEVQNIVDVSFEDMAYKIEAFSNTCIESFGMSELSAKQTAGSFMAMGKAMDLDMETASDMAVELTGLSGDMASFYNISQDYARVALSAVYTGETETLKRYGIVLTEANLQQYALTQGITTSVKQMDAASKAALRYNYIMHATADIQGDFTRTAGNWANQVRLLKEQWTVFLNVVGKGLITVLTPVLHMINKIIAAMITMAKVIGSALANIFGLDIQSVSDAVSNVADATDDAADGVGDLGDAEDDTASSTAAANKELKKQLGLYDELNVISQDTPSSSSGSGSGGGGGGVAIDTVDTSLLDQAYDTIADKLSDITNLFDLGRAISEKLTASLNSIPWQDIYAAADNFGKGLAEFLNGLITPELFAAVGNTIAGALNTALHFLNSFGEEFDWTNFGNSLNAGLSTFLDRFDWALLRKTAKTWAKGLADSLNAFITPNLFGKIGTAIAESLNTVLDFLNTFGTEFDWTNFGDSLAEGVNNFFDTFDFALLADTIDTWVQGVYEAIKTFIEETDWSKVWDGIVEFISNIDIETVSIVIDTLTILGVGKLVFGTVPAFIAKQLATTIAAEWAAGGGLTGLAEGFSLFAGGNVGSLAEGMTAVFGPVVGILTTIASVLAVVGGGVLALVNFATMLQDGFSWVNEILMLIGITLGVVGAIFLGIAATPAIIAGAIIAAVATIVILVKDNWNTIKKLLGKAVSWIMNGVINPIVGFFRDLWNGIKDMFSGMWDSIQAVWEGAVEWFNTTVDTVSTFFSDLWDGIKNMFSGMWDSIKAIWDGAVEVFNTTVSNISDFFSDLWDGISNMFSGMWDSIKAVWDGAVDWFNTTVSSISGFFTDLGDGISNMFSGMWVSITTVWSQAKDWFKKHVTEPIKKAFDNMWSGIKKIINFMLSGVENFINGVINALNIFIGGIEDIGRGIATITGSDYNGITRLNTVSLPRLAQGAVIPPNKEFMAILGDQKSGVNIETPLDTMIEAFKTALNENGGGNNQPIVLQLNGSDIAQAVWDENDKRYKQTGYKYA